MGNLQSIPDDNCKRVHFCDKSCGFYTTKTTLLNAHKQQGCHSVDRRYRQAAPVLPVQPLHQHVHNPPAADQGANDETLSHELAENAACADEDVSEGGGIQDLRGALAQQFCQRFQQNGDEVDHGAVAGLAELVAGALENDLEQDDAAGMDDALDELRELLGVDLHPSTLNPEQQPSYSEGADPDTEKELQRSVYVLAPHNGRPILPENVRKMWQHLRSGLLYFCRSNPTPGVAQTVQAAQADLKEYASCCEQLFGTNMCKFNLHLLICRLADQEAVRGKAAHSTEYWIENLIQWAKSTVRYRTTKYPELVLASDMLADDGIARCIAAHHAQGMREVVNGWLHADRVSLSFLNVDDGDDDGTQLLGSGKPLSEGDHSVVVKSVCKHIVDCNPTGWQPHGIMLEDLVASAEMLFYTYADIRGSEILHSIRYTRARTRVSYNVLCQYFDRANAVEHTNHIAQVQCFVKVLPPPLAPDAEPLRMAVSHLFELQEVVGGVGTLYHSPTYPLTPKHSYYSVHFSIDENGWGAMQDKHVMASSGQGGAFFMPYSNMSASSGQDASYE